MRRSLSKQDGSTLAVVITTMAILMVTAAIAVEYTTNETRMVQRTVTLQNALAIGDSAIDVLFNSWRATCRTLPTTAFKTSDFSAIATPSPFPNARVSSFVKRGTGYNPAVDTDYDSTYTISNYKIIAVSAEYGALANTAATPEPALGQLNGNIGSVTPSTAASFNYMASADVTLPVSFGTATNKNVVAKVRRVFTKQQQSPWNYAIFYVDPLEIHPGPLFTVTGWVHTNSDLYTGHVTLKFADKVTYGSDWFVGFMPGDSSHPETPANPLYPNKLPPARDQVLQPFGLDSTAIFNTSDSNPNNDSYHELIEPPVLGSPDPLSTARYWNQAGIVIEVQDNPKSNKPGFDGVNGHDLVKFYTVNSGTGATTLISSGNLYDMFSGAITTNQSIQDNREATSVKLASLDISQIVDENGGGNPTYSSNFNGIVYIHSISDAAGNRRGIRIKNGSRIPTSG
ncbi:MAG: hypothetical protein M3Y27_31095, partial [Acidobacteriota bacterium]|nr:hypothetical protein [Acidobacteriota bacterium]